MAATKPEKQAVSDVVLFNSASVDNVENRAWKRLGIDFIRSGTDLTYYADHNPQWAYQEDPKDMLRIPRRLRGHLPAPIKGMAATNDSKTLFAPLQEGRLDSRINLIHCERDIVSNASNNLSAQQYLQRIPSAEVRREQLAGEYHGITGHLGSLAVALDDIINAKY